MDYLKTPITYKIKKVLRYIRLYGPSRTLAKVQGQLHMKRRYDQLPENRKPASPKQTVGIIGCGNYAYTTIAYYIQKNAGKVIRGVMDIDINKSASLHERYGSAFYTDNADEIIDDEAIDIVYIASNHSTHAEYAIKALEKNKNVYIEKPHVVNEDQLIRLVAAMKNSEGKVFLGFNRPGSRLGKLTREYLSKEDGAGMYNWFVAGHAIDPDHWYFKAEEGGRILGNLCHWTDFTLRLVPNNAYPIEINPTRAEKSDCDIAVAYKFADGTLAAITFSAKGHTFEGVKEHFSAHKGNCLLSLEDFYRLRVEVGDMVKVYKNRFRDHGHEINIIKAYKSVKENLPYNREEQTAYIWNTGQLFLKTKEAMERNEKVVVEPYSAECLP